MTTKIAAKREDRQPTDGCRTEVLLSKGALGEVSVCSAGCVHIDSPAISIRMTEPDFRALVRMVSAAATQLTVVQDAAMHQARPH